MEISFDEHRVVQDGRYDPDDLYDAVDKIGAQLHLRKADKGVYCGTGSRDDYSNFGSFILTLKGQHWFLSYVDKWKWYIDKGGKREESITVEDVAEHYRRKGLIPA